MLLQFCHKNIISSSWKICDTGHLWREKYLKINCGSCLIRGLNYTWGQQSNILSVKSLHFNLTRSADYELNVTFIWITSFQMLSSRHSSMVSMVACYRRGPSFKSRQGRENINFWLKRKFNNSNLNTIIVWVYELTGLV